MNLHHLTHEQLCDLLLENHPPSVHQVEHLRSCSRCAAEYNSLRESISLFRSTTIAWASHVSASRSWPSPIRLLATATARRSDWAGRLLTQPVLWAAAAMLLIASAVPLALHHPQEPAAAVQSNPPAQVRPIDHIGDEALLEEVDQTLSSSIPAPMQPLADPTAGRSSQIDSTPRKN
jgi:anti-sigma factor RsiW